MNALRLVPVYIFWHYTGALLDFFRIAGNMYWFLWHFFSVPETFRTFFEPWERIREKYHKGLDIEAVASAFVANTLMRILGVIMRTFLLFFAFISFIVLSVVVVVSFFVWLIMPFGLLFFAIAGIGSLFK